MCQIRRWKEHNTNGPAKFRQSLKTNVLIVSGRKCRNYIIHSRALTGIQYCIPYIRSISRIFFPSHDIIVLEMLRSGLGWCTDGAGRQIVEYSWLPVDGNGGV